MRLNLKIEFYPDGRWEGSCPLLFRQYLSPAKASTFSADNGKGSSFSLRLLDSLWNGSGKLAPANVIDDRSFSDLHNDIIRDLFLSYGEAAGDRILLRNRLF